jgi:hypothetical protein
MRSVLRSLLFVSFLACTLASAHAGRNACLVSVRPLGESGAKSLNFVCLESANSCRNFMTFLVDGKPLNIAVEATCAPGTLYLKFRTVPENVELSESNWPDLSLPIGGNSSIRRHFALSAVSEAAQKDAPGGLLQRPVIKGSTPPLATVEVEVALGQTPD